MTDLTAALSSAFAPFDAEMLVKDIEWAHGRVAALAAFRKSEEYEAIKRDVYKLYDRYFHLAGGKSWFNAFSGRNAAMIEELMTKNAKARADKRNATVAAKLAKAGVTEIGDFEFSRNSDGFNGVFLFNGVRVEVRTILAGGYNIQCLHARVLVYINGRKA